MSPEMRREAVRCAARWCSNILIEVLGNHHKVLDRDTCASLKLAIEALHKVQAAGLRQER